MKLRYLPTLAILTILVPTLLHAQGGCIDSPENPTALLALVGAGAATLTQHLRTRR